MKKTDVYADVAQTISAGIVVQSVNLPTMFFSHLTPGHDFDSGYEAIQGDLAEQTKETLVQINKALRQANGGPGGITRLVIYLKDRPDALRATKIVTEAVADWFSFERPGNVVLPARSVVFVCRLPYDHLGQLVGIEATAIVK